jgi:flavin-dependent dehydrogenase
MKYDLVICGAGPGGLSAPMTVAADGLKVLVLERKRNISEVNRLCGRFKKTGIDQGLAEYKPPDAHLFEAGPKP